ncbi:GntR family transcriptional regulator [Thermoactinomyces sp. CICC 10522]|uniref:GntR family transcriptional regulator n=1 Tax=Thermoactinomyces sp. CICC 10522 TaxID=2767427 RepID=UPI0018DECE8B|nr:GntR family transcriptional regulator [Thermoactinomyces sp. CICC 10522]MBH8605563.1 GntR family transcriptional regulator [Thermoactinomyces sp. CICC 10522]
MEERQVGSFRFQLDLSQPIYEQILQQIRSLIAKGKVNPGEKIPSVREMAKALRVNPNTVMRAYQELERDGLTEKHRGQGTFITTSSEQIARFRRELMEQYIEEFFAQMESLGFTWTELESAIYERYKKQKGGDT